MYQVTHRDIITAINDYNTGLNNHLESILTRLDLNTKASMEVIYLDNDIDLPYNTYNKIHYIMMLSQ